VWLESGVRFRHRLNLAGCHCLCLRFSFVSTSWSGSFMGFGVGGSIPMGCVWDADWIVLLEFVYNHHFFFSRVYKYR